MAANFHPNLSDPTAQEHFHLFDFNSVGGLCHFDKLFRKYFGCQDCPFGSDPDNCSLSYDYNPHLHLFVEQYKLAYPELFI